jgi:predicted TIM-barrel fold metal-dependent hydrolase
MAQLELISADSHFVEPPEMWAERIDPAFRSRAPYLVPTEDQRGAVLVCEGLVPNGGGTFFGAGTDPEQVAELMARGWEAVPDHSHDPAARIKAQDVDGIRAEVLYASYGMYLYSLEDQTLRTACFHAFNDWASEYCRHDGNRLWGIGLISPDDPSEAVKDLEAIEAGGLKGAMIWAEPSADRPYSHPMYEPFFAAAQDMDMKLSLHSLTSRRRETIFEGTDMLYRSGILYQEVARTLSDLIIHGVLERFPRLKFVLVENEISWLPFHLWKMDSSFGRISKMSMKLSMKPSEYFQRQVYATFINDPMVETSMSRLGSTNFMWSTDFPHLASNWPHSHEYIESALGDIGSSEQARLVHDNVSSLYGMA